MSAAALLYTCWRKSHVQAARGAIAAADRARHARLARYWNRKLIAEKRASR